jgi:NTP pyrophosphatase (non-canonical NTP hydrolase)
MFDFERSEFETAIFKMARKVNKNAKEKGFYDHERNVGETLALIHSEVSEILEAVRSGGFEEPSEKVPEITEVAEECADVVIRILDFCYAKDIDLGRAIFEKHKYNTTRPYRHGKAF